MQLNILLTQKFKTSGTMFSYYGKRVDRFDLHGCSDEVKGQTTSQDE